MTMEPIERTADYAVSLIRWMLRYDEYPVECGVKTFARGRIEFLTEYVQGEINQHKITKQQMIKQIKSMYDDDANKAKAHLDLLDKLKFTEE